MNVIPESCERFRGSVSLAVDGMLSTFEARLLERHLEACASCEAFAADVREQTLQLRAAPLELAPQLVADIGRAAPRRSRRVATFAAAGVAAAAAAVFAVVPSHTQQHAEASQSSNHALLAVVPKQPTANKNFEVPRLELVSPASADGPVRGYFGVPA